MTTTNNTRMKKLTIIGATAAFLANPYSAKAIQNTQIQPVQSTASASSASMERAADVLLRQIAEVTVKSFEEKGGKESPVAQPMPFPSTIKSPGMEVTINAVNVYKGAKDRPAHYFNDVTGQIEDIKETVEVNAEIKMNGNSLTLSKDYVFTQKGGLVAFYYKEPIDPHAHVPYSADAPTIRRIAEAVDITNFPYDNTKPQPLYNNTGIVTSDGKLVDVIVSKIDDYKRSAYPVVGKEMIELYDSQQRHEAGKPEASGDFDKGKHNVVPVYPGHVDLEALKELSRN